MTKKTLVVIASSILGAIILGTNAFADEKVYPGSICLPNNTYDPIFMDSNYWQRNDTGRATGTYTSESASGESAYCSLVTDEITISSLSVVVYNYSSGINFSCRAVSLTWNLVPVQFWYSDEASTSSQGIHTLTIDVSGDELNWPDALHYVVCDVPPNSKIIRIKINEDGGDPL